jgi:hypothetical protein
MGPATVSGSDPETDRIPRRRGPDTLRPPRLIQFPKLMNALKEWENFYVIVGSSAGALIGLQFVVLTLVAENPMARSLATGRTFGAPTIVHFSAVLLLSAIASAPWHDSVTIAIVFGLIGLSGITYSFIVARRLRFADRIQASVRGLAISRSAPTCGAVTLTLSAFALSSHAHGALLGIGAAALLLLLSVYTMRGTASRTISLRRNLEKLNRREGS